MSLIDHVALSIDFSEASEVAARGALKLAELTGAKHLTVLHAIKRVVLPEGDQPKVRERLEKLHDRIREAAQQQCAEMIAAMSVPPGLKVDYELVEGRPAVVIPAAAKKLGARLLMIGTASRKGLRRWVKGSVAETMIRNTEVPTLVLLSGTDGVEPEVELMNLRRVLIAVDLDSGSDEVARIGLKLASAFKHVDPEVTLMSVTELPEAPLGEEEINEYRSTLRDVATAQMERMVEKHGDAELQIATHICDGEAKDKILELAESFSVGLIVVGTHGQGGAPLIDIGSNTARVVRNSDVAVLVVPSHPEQLPS